MVPHADFSPDGRRVVTASEDGTARVWDAATGQPLTPPLVHNGAVWHAAISPDGRRLVTASDDGKARLWDAVTGQLIIHSLSHGGPLHCAAFSPDGRRVITASDDGTARVWDLAMDESSAEDVVRLSELLVCHRLDKQGGMIPVDPQTWHRSWYELQAKYPTQFASTPERIRAWHREEAVACAAAGLWPGAIQHLDVVLEADPANRDFRRNRAGAHAALAHWPEAAGDFAKAQEGEANLQLAGWHAACLAAAGEWSSHRKACAALLEQFGKNPDQANDLAWCCVRFRKGPGDVLGTLKLAEQNGATNPKDAKVLNTLGAALYRAGRYTDAIGKLQDGFKIRNDEGTAFDWLFLALAHDKLGHGDEAKKWLAKAQQWINQAPKEGANALPWDQRLELQLLRAEAEEAILSRK
jgi:tetratricopeptide (TPR) repeat protein